MIHLSFILHARLGPLAFLGWFHLSAVGINVAQCSFPFTVMHYTVTDRPATDTFHSGRSEI